MAWFLYVPDKGFSPTTIWRKHILCTKKKKKRDLSLSSVLLMTITVFHSFICFRIKICPGCYFCMYDLWPSLARLRIKCDVSYLLITNCKEKLNCLKIGWDVTQSCGLWCTFPLVRGWEIIMESGSLRVTWLRFRGFMFYTDTTHIPALNSKVNFFSPHYPVIMQLKVVS